MPTFVTQYDECSAEETYSALNCYAIDGNKIDPTSEDAEAAGFGYMTEQVGYQTVRDKVNTMMLAGENLMDYRQNFSQDEEDDLREEGMPISSVYGDDPVDLEANLRYRMVKKLTPVSPDPPVGTNPPPAQTNSSSAQTNSASQPLTNAVSDTSVSPPMSP